MEKGLHALLILFDIVPIEGVAVPYVKYSVVNYGMCPVGTLPALYAK